MAGALGLGLSLVTGFDALARGLAKPGVLTSYAVMILLGWLGASILAVSYRVLPNLAWHHRFGARARQPGTPPPAAMVVPALGWVTLATHTLGLLAMMGGLHRSSPAMVQTGAALFTLDAASGVLTSGNGRTQIRSKILRAGRGMSSAG